MDASQNHQAPHSFSQGRPKGHVFQTVSTHDVALAERYEYWTGNVIRNFEVATPDDRQRQDFTAKVTSLATLAGEMHYAESDAYTAHLARDTIGGSLAFDELSLLLMVKGKVRYAYDDGQDMEVGAGGFFLLDGSRPTSLRFSRHSVIQLDLSRSLLESVFPGSMPAPALVNAALANSRLSGLLRDHLRQFPGIATGMAPLEQLALLDASESFAITTIEGTFSTAIGMSEHSHAGLLAAAQRYIRRHLTDRDISPASVAAAIGCSRSMLYKLFSESELTVYGYIRELRLQQLLRLLQKEKGNVPIHTLAQRCGLYNTPNVNRVFRNRFGMSPSEARAAANRRPDGHG
ncbi:helix-turn-helix domain-containing protein [Qingshengfaniella alkalisoli]|nr:helix-turn-helix domain-containing protein [Qingshengfaniella alkalisoli]